MIITEKRGQNAFSQKGQVVNSLVLQILKVSVGTTQLCHC